MVERVFFPNELKQFFILFENSISVYLHLQNQENNYVVENKPGIIWK